MPLEFSSADDEPSLQDVVSVLDDEDCRTIVAVLDEPMTVPEIADTTGLPLSSTYRKLDRLTQGGLVTETVGVRSGRHHKSRYVVDFDRISIALDEDRTFRVDVDRTRRDSMDLWSNVSREF